MTAIEDARAARARVDDRLAVARLGKSMMREMNRDMLALKEAGAVLDALIAEHERVSASDDARGARLMSIVTPLGYAQALVLLEAEATVECPHWSPGRIALRRACTSCATEATR